MPNHPSGQTLNGRAAALRRLIVAGLLLLPTTSAAAASFGELEGWCAPPDAGGRPGLCSGYLETYIEALASTDSSLNHGVRACVPQGEDRAKVMRLLRAHARGDPSSRDRPGMAGLGQALHGHYPCR